MPERINIYEAKAHYSKIVTKVQETGESITICKNGKPVVDVIQHRAVGDPFDRLIIATAKFRGLTILSMDEVIPRYPNVEVVWR